MPSDWNDLDDDEWQDMPVIRPTAETSALDAEDRKRYHWNSSGTHSHLRDSDTSTSSSLAGGANVGNATGKLIDYDASGKAWKEKEQLDEMDYTRLELDDDPDEDEISMRTQYLFNEDKGMTPLSQMQATKTLLTEGQRIAYVGLCRLVAREMVQAIALAAKGAKELDPAKESAHNWANKIMGRLYRHMEVDGAEQRMIDQLAEHGVTAEDLTPSLLTTYTVDNPEYDPEAAVQAAADEAERVELARQDEIVRLEREQHEEEERRIADAQREEEELAAQAERLRAEEEAGRVAREVAKIERRESLARGADPFGQDDDYSPSSPSTSFPRSPSLRSLPSSPSKPSRTAFPNLDDEGEGDIGGALGARSTTPKPALSPLAIRPDSPAAPSTPTLSVTNDDDLEEPTTPRPDSSLSPTTPTKPSTEEPPTSPKTHDVDNFLTPLPSTLPGVSQTLSAADKTITLDIRWTILCDLFLSLIADSVYDARSRVLLGKMADKLGLEWIDVVRFERRLTEALEIQESVAEKEHLEVLEERMKKGKKKRYVMMGLATLGGGLVIGLSAGLLAPVIGAGLGAALTTVGVTGTTGFLAGAGGAAVISSGATLTGSIIGGKAMAKRTRHVKTFEFQPLHNNKRVNFFITVPGFMNGPLDDVRLPFSTIDPLMGDVFSVLWEPEMMGDTGNALKILSSEVLTQAGQQVLAMTVMTALMSALQWPMMLTKLSYLIDNPWSNALDRARQAGAVLADILINRRLGVRPVSLVGFSLGARVIFYALVELAKANAFGVVQEVYLFGATVTASKKVWRQVRGIVSGRFVNAFAMNDWVLGYLFRATSGGLQTVAGLRPIDYVPDLENVDITSLLVGHMSYRTLMPTLLAHVGFKTTADHFDEPEEMDQDAPDREVLTAEQEEERRQKKEKKGLAGIFKKKKKANSQPMSRRTSGDYDLPPRMASGSSLLVNTTTSATNSDDTIAESSGMSRQRSESEVSEISSDGRTEYDDEHPTPPLSSEEASPVIPAAEQSKPIGFDLAKLRAEVAQLPNKEAVAAEIERPSSVPPPVAASSSPLRDTTDFSTSSSQPPPSAAAFAPIDDDLPRSSSAPPPVVLMPPQTDLTHLDQTLDPRELLRRQWAGESALPSLPPAAAAFDDSSNAWSASSASSFSFASPNGASSLDYGASSSRPLPPPPPAPVFTFANSEGSVSWNDEDDGGFGSGANGHKRKDSFDDAAPDPAGAAFVWGSKGGSNNASTASFAANPW